MPIPNSWKLIQWSKFSDRLSENLRTNANKKTIKTNQGHIIEYNEIKAMLAKNIIDEIDIELGKLYKLSKSEAEYIINYDIKYRMG